MVFFERFDILDVVPSSDQMQNLKKKLPSVDFLSQVNNRKHQVQ